MDSLEEKYEILVREFKKLKTSKKELADSHKEVVEKNKELERKVKQLQEENKTIKEKKKKYKQNMNVLEEKLREKGREDDVKRAAEQMSQRKKEEVFRELNDDRHKVNFYSAILSYDRA